MTEILITGIAGFIGSNLAEKLLSLNYKVIGIDNYDPFYDRKVKERNISEIYRNKQFYFYEYDILNNNNLQNVFNSHSIDVVIHLAAKAGVRPSIDNPYDYYRVNVLGTMNLLEVMKSFNCNKIIYASSSSVYGNNTKIPFSEDDPVDNPISPYAATKKTGELICHTYHHLYGFDVTCLRFFTVYGPRQRPDLAIYKFTKSIINNSPIPFYGNGNTERDYTYIDDLIAGIVGAIKNISGYNIFNLGESRTISLKSMVSQIENIIGKKAILNKLPLQKGDMIKTYANINKAKKVLGYNPIYSFELGLEKFVDWYNDTIR